MHLDAETLERVLHGELDAERNAAAREHLSGCPACEAALEESRLRERRVFGLFEALDHEAPSLDWEAIEAPEGGRSGRLLVAASIAFVLAAGILYALPDSPLRGWIDRAGSEAPAPEAEPGGARSISGLSILPAAPFEILFAGGQESGVIRLELADTPELEIRILGDPVDLESRPDRVTVRESGVAVELCDPATGGGASDHGARGRFRRVRQIGGGTRDRGPSHGKRRVPDRPGTAGTLSLPLRRRPNVE